MSKCSVISSVFHQLNKKGISYAVLRNYQSLPQDPGNDIDLAIDGNEVSNFSNVLQDVSDNQNCYCLLKENRFSFRTFVIFPKDLRFEPVKFDIWYPIRWKGIEWIDTEYILANADKRENNIRVIPDGSEAASLLLKDILQSSTIKPKYRERIIELLEENEEEFRISLKKGLPSPAIDDLLQKSKHEDWAGIERESWFIQLQVIAKEALSGDSSIWNSTVRFFSGHITESKDTTFLCLIGPDGSGKSTFAKKLKRNVRKYYDSADYFHGYFQILPKIKDIIPDILSPTEIEDAAQEPSEGGSRSGIQPILQRALLFYYTIDSILGYQINKSQLGSNIMIFDRYLYDFIIQPQGIPQDSLFFKLMMHFAPTPDIVLFLHAPPEAIVDRKPELTKSEIERQQSKCADIIDQTDNGYQIDNSGPVDSTLSQITQILFETVQR